MSSVYQPKRKELNDDDVICEMVDFVIKYVLFDDVIDYETDVKYRKTPHFRLKKPSNLPVGR